MISTLVWRLKESWAVLSGRKKTQKIAIRSDFPKKSIDTLTSHIIEDEGFKSYLDNISVEFCFSEFGEKRVNCGGSEFHVARLEPSLSSLKKYFPKAKFTVYSDFDLITNRGGVEVKRVSSPIKDPKHPRYLYRTADYFKFVALLYSDADFKCAIDSDMFVVSDDIYRLVYLTELFGACVPYNPRNLLRVDMEISKDVRPIDDLSGAMGHSYNQTPMTLWKNDERGSAYYRACCEQMIKNPSRASRVMWNASHDTGYSPYLLPQQWCVCAEDVGIGHEVMLHVGHPEVAKYYNVEL